MKILKIFGIVVGIHVFALILIFANPGCSSTSKPQAPDDSAAKSAPAPVVSTPPSAPTTPASSSSGSSAITFNPNAPAIAPAPSTSGDAVRYSPTRPGNPASGALVAEPVTDVTPTTSYTVKSGDSLSAIAKRHHTTTAELTAANNLTPNSILRPGQKLLIPSKPSSPVVAAPSAATGGIPPPAKTDAAPAPGAARPSGDVMKHVVKSGETLGGIAKKYEVRQADIAILNNIADPAKIRPGMELLIPGWQPTGAKKTQKSSGSSTKKSSPPPATTTPATTTPVETPPTPSPQPPPPTNTTPPAVPVIRIDETAAPPKN